MDKLAALFVSVVTAANVVAPGANIPRVLGVSEAYQDRVETRSEEQNTSTYSAGVNERTTQRTALREEYQHRLQSLKDERKRKVLENLDTNLSQVKDKWVTIWTNTLTRFDKILAKLEAKNVTTAQDEIAAAKSAIADAQAKVAAVASKDYVFTINSEDTLGEDARSFIATFKEDMLAVHASLAAARDALQAAFTAVNQGIAS